MMVHGVYADVLPGFWMLMLWNVEALLYAIIIYCGVAVVKWPFSR